MEMEKRICNMHKEEEDERKSFPANLRKALNEEMRKKN